jgi:hypothetical protein
MGLGDGIGQKKPCHHLGPFFSNFLPEKILGYLKKLLRKKLRSAKKVTKLPALTVFVMPGFIGKMIGRYTYCGSYTYCAHCTGTFIARLP